MFSVSGSQAHSSVERPTRDTDMFSSIGRPVRDVESSSTTSIVITSWPLHGGRWLQIVRIVFVGVAGWWMENRGRPKVVRLDPDKANMTNRMLDLLQCLQQDVQVTPPEAPWHLSVLGVVSELLTRTDTLCALDDGRRSSCSECLTIAHSRFLNRDGYAPFQLLCDLETEPVEGSNES